MAQGDGNGWVACRCGRRHWGRFGAAGLLLVRAHDDGVQVLLQHRAAWVHEGGTWGLPGGARDSHEDAVVAALREAHEEASLLPEHVAVLAVLPGADHGDWRYDVVLGAARAAAAPSVANDESLEVRWVAPDEVPALPLHTGLARSWPGLHADLAGRDPAGWTLRPGPGSP